MSTFYPQATKKGACWCYRLVNGVQVYSIDLTHDALIELVDPTQAQIETECARAMFASLLERCAVETVLHRWTRDNPFAAQRTRYALLVNNAHTNLFTHEREARGAVRSMNAARNVRLPMVCGGGGDNNKTERTYTSTVVVLQQRFASPAHQGEVFNEFVVLGLVPWFVNNTAGGIELSDVLLNTRFDGMSTAQRALYERCQLPRVNLRTFGANERVECMAERLLSFCVRWHVARHSPAATAAASSNASLFQTVMASAAASSGGVRAELERQLFNATRRYTTPASEAIFAHPATLFNLHALWVDAALAPPARRWMARQLSDAVQTLVRVAVIERGETAMQVFCDECLLPALAFFVPQYRATRRGAACVGVDFYSVANSPLNVDFERLFKAHPPLRGEPPPTLADGCDVLPLSVACHLYSYVFAAALEHLASAPDTVSGTRVDREHLVDDTVLPVNGRDLYRTPRTTRFDDVPLGSVLLDARAAALKQSDFLLDPEVLAMLQAGLPVAAHMVLGADDDALSHRLTHSMSIPLRHSRQFLVVSQSALHDICSQPATEVTATTVDIEDAVPSAPTSQMRTRSVSGREPSNLVVLLHQRYALPLCARRLTAKFVDERTHVGYRERDFLYRFLRSLNLPDLTHDEITAFITMNSRTPSEDKRTKHRKHCVDLRKFSEKMLERQVRNRVASGASEADASAAASCLGNCSTQAKAGFCPFASAAGGGGGNASATAFDAAALRTLLARVNLVLRNDAAALERVVAAASGGAWPRAACRQEFTETRRHIDVAFDEVDIDIQRPAQYMAASAQHAEKRKNRQQATH